MTEDDAIILESLIKSRAWEVLKRILNQDKMISQGVLIASKDLVAIYRAQGRLTGLNVITNLPEVLVKQNIVKKAKESKKNAKKS